MIQYTRNSALVHRMSFAEFAREVQPLAGCPTVPLGGNTWTGNMSLAEAKEYALAGGSTELVQDAQKLIDAIPLEQLPECSAYRWNPSISGAYASVPDYLAGVPASMRQRIKTVRDTAPLRIYAGVSASAAIRGSQLQNHFNALIALSLLIERTRPVELYVVQGSRTEKRERIGRGRNRQLDASQGNEVYLVIQIDTQPLSLAQACFALSVGCKRQLYFSYLNRKMSVPSIIPNVDANSDETIPVIWESDGTPGDGETPLYFPAITPNAISTTSPVEWVTRMMQAYLTTGVCRAI